MDVSFQSLIGLIFKRFEIISFSFASSDSCSSNSDFKFVANRSAEVEKSSLNQVKSQHALHWVKRIANLVLLPPLIGAGYRNQQYLHSRLQIYSHFTVCTGYFINVFW